MSLLNAIVMLVWIHSLWICMMLKGATVWRMEKIWGVPVLTYPSPSEISAVAASHRELLVLKMMMIGQALSDFSWDNFLEHHDSCITYSFFFSDRLQTRELSASIAGRGRHSMGHNIISISAPNEEHRIGYTEKPHQLFFHRQICEGDSPQKR